MSHNVAVQNVAIKSISALEAAVAELAAEGVPITMEKRSKFKTYSGQPDHCDYAIKVEGVNMEIGVVKDPKTADEFRFVCDPYDYGFGNKGTLGTHLKADWGTDGPPKPTGDYRRYDDQAVENTLGKLTQRYSLCVSEETLRGRGYSIVGREFNQQNGNYELLAEELA